MKRILLLNAPGPEFLKFEESHIPLAPLYIASSLRQHGYEVRYIDVHNEEILMERAGTAFDLEAYFTGSLSERLSAWAPDFVCMFVHFSGRFRPAVKLATLLKAAMPDLPIITGGIHPTMFAVDIMQDMSCFDYIMKGEAEASLVEFFAAHFEGKGSFADVDGLVYRDASGQVVGNKKAKFIEDLDALPFPAYDMVNVKDYSYDTSKWQNPRNLDFDMTYHLITSRSCPIGCVFCSLFMVHGNRFRPRSPKNTVDEIEHLYRDYGQSYFSIMDDNFTMNKRRAVEIANEIVRRNLVIQFDMPHGMFLETVDEELVDALVRAGWIRASVAVETGSDALRRTMGKKLTSEQIYRAFDIFKKYEHLRINGCFVLGMPQETRETLGETFEMIKRLELKNLALHVATPFPGTPLYDYCVAHNCFSRKVPQDKLYYCEDFYWYSKTPLIKPFALEVEDIIEFRTMVYSYVHSQDKGRIAYRD